METRHVSETSLVMETWQVSETSLMLETRQVCNTSFKMDTQQVSEMLVFCSEFVWIVFGDYFIPLNYV
jgi:hypothetical protein